MQNNNSKKGKKHHFRLLEQKNGSLEQIKFIQPCLFYKKDIPLQRIVFS